MAAIRYWGVECDCINAFRRFESNADVNLWNYITKCPIAALILLEKVAHSHCVKRTAIPRQPQHTRVGGTNQRHCAGLQSVAVHTMAPHHVLLLSLAVLTTSAWEAAGQDRKIREYTSRCKGQGQDRTVGTGPAFYRLCNTVRLWSYPASN
jgi:hypothetical protein